MTCVTPGCVRKGAETQKSKFAWSTSSHLTNPSLILLPFLFSLHCFTFLVFSFLPSFSSSLSPLLILSPAPFSLPSFISILHSSLSPAFPSFSRFPFRFIMFDFAFFAYADLLPSLVLACSLNFCSLAAFTFARVLSLLLLTCGLYFCSLALAKFFVDSLNGL